MFSTLYRSVLMVWRMLKNACLRPFRSLYARMRRATNVTRQASKVVPKIVKSVTTVSVKPKKREDYVDAGPVYIAKSLVFVILGAAVALWLLGQFVVWPWAEGKWFTAKLCLQEQKVETYTGRVRLYYDEGKKSLAFQGRLEDGKKQGKGVEYHENGVEAFSGAFEDGLYAGQGTQRDQEGRVTYEGGYALGLYQGEGRLYEEGALVYEGAFSQGARTGKGKEYVAGTLAYEGEFVDGVYSGAGKTYYANGRVRAECLTFSGGKPDGSCVTYYENGQKQYEGACVQGVRSGQGTLYDEGGAKIYAGEFDADERNGAGTEYFPGGAKKYEGGWAQDVYEGEGTLYQADGSVKYAGGFSQGLYAGAGRLALAEGRAVEGVFAQGEVTGAVKYYQVEQLLYEGALAEGDAQGEGVLYKNGVSVYTGAFAAGFIDGHALLDMPVTDLRQGVFAGASLLDSEAENGFLIKNEGLDAAVFCNYGYDDAEIVVHRVYLYGESLKSRFAGGGFAVPEGALSSSAAREIPLLIPGVRASVQAAHSVTRYVYADCTLRVWTDEAGAVDLIEWRSQRELAAVPAGQSEGGEAETVEGLLEALGLAQAEEDAV